MSYLRFTQLEYRTIARVCCPLDLGCYDPPTFQRILALSVSRASPRLAGRILGLRKAEVQLLYGHLHAGAGRGPRPPFTPEEWRAFAKACRSVPSSARFVRPFQQVLVQQFREGSPLLARKVIRLSGDQFVRLYEQVRERRRGNG